MNSPEHILICGEVGAGKSTLVRRLLKHSQLPLYGFKTQKAPPDDTGSSCVYIHPANTDRYTYSQENLVGICGMKVVNATYPEIFNTIGVELLNAPPEGLLLMDELGFMESSAFDFCNGVIAAMDGEVPVLAVVKSMDIPFLKKVRSHKNAGLYNITPQNRDILYEELLPKVLAWNKRIN